MTILNNTARRLAQNEALVAWAETRRLVPNAMKPNKQSHIFSRLVQSRAKPNKPFQKHKIQSILLVMVMCWHAIGRLVLNAMKPNKPFRKRQISSILFMMVMCWASQSSAQPTRAVGVCYVINGTNDVYGNRLDKGDRHVQLFPNFNAARYMGRYEGKDIRFEGGTTFKLIQAPKHGVIKDLTNTTDPNMPGGGGYQYLANEGYFGDDFAIMRVQNKGISVDVYYFIRVTELHENVSQVYLENCPAVYRGSYGSWKISATTPDGTPIFSNEDTAVSSAGAYTPTPSPLLGNYSNSAYPNLTYSFTNLPGTAVGQTIGEGTAANILLDINAAGRGWFMDSTPLSNDDYLPTSNPNEWIAKAGSAAADKMDLLSALVGWVEV